PSIPEMIEALEIEYDAWIANKKQPVKSQVAIERVKKVFDWEDKRQFIEGIFEDVLSTPDQLEGGNFVLESTSEKVEEEPE
nr:hypothetical protein [Candidatus Brocadiales bacterium]